MAEHLVVSKARVWVVEWVGLMVDQKDVTWVDMKVASLVVLSVLYLVVVLVDVMAEHLVVSKARERVVVWVVGMVVCNRNITTMSREEIMRMMGW
jgi:hypothetical protein